MAIDRPSQVAFAQLHPRAKRAVAAAYLRPVLDKPPYKAHKGLPDNGGQSKAQPQQVLPGGHSFDHIYRACGVEYRPLNSSPKPLPSTQSRLA